MSLSTLTSSKRNEVNTHTHTHIKPFQVWPTHPLTTSCCGEGFNHCWALYCLSTSVDLSSCVQVDDVLTGKNSRLWPSCTYSSVCPFREEGLGDYWLFYWGSTVVFYGISLSLSLDREVNFPTLIDCYLCVKTQSPLNQTHMIYSMEVLFEVIFYLTRKCCVKQQITLISNRRADFSVAM